MTYAVYWQEYHMIIEEQYNVIRK